MSAAWAKARRRGWVRTSDGYKHPTHGTVERGDRCWRMSSPGGGWHGIAGTMTRAMRFLELLSCNGWRW